MKSSLICAALLALCAAPLSAGELVVELNGPGLAESAGYLVAKARGFYAAEGLEVRLHPPGNAIPLEALARGKADLAVEFLPVALLARENGLPLVNIGQPFALPALRLTCLREAGVQTAADLRGKTLGSDYRGQELALSGWVNKLGLRADDSLEGVSILRQWPDDAAGMLRQKQAACISTTSYDAPVEPGGTVELDPGDQGAGVLEDGIYALQDKLPDPAMRDRFARFLRASMQGWHEAVRDPEASARLILGPDPDPEALKRQTRAIKGIAPLLSAQGALDDAAYRRSVAILREGGDAAVLRADPQNAFTHEISDLARKAGQRTGARIEPTPGPRSTP